jgi:hypothetical protein
MKAIDLTKITQEERLQEVHAKVDELQKRLGRELQVIIYSSTHYPEDVFDDIATSMRLSVISFSTGDNKKEKYAVRVTVAKVGEIPFALSCGEIYTAGGTPSEEPALCEQTQAALALASVVTSSLDSDQLYGFLNAARNKGKINDDQFLLVTSQFL